MPTITQSISFGADVDRPKLLEWLALGVQLDNPLSSVGLSANTQPSAPPPPAPAVVSQSAALMPPEAPAPAQIVPGLVYPAANGSGHSTTGTDSQPDDSQAVPRRRGRPPGPRNVPVANAPAEAAPASEGFAPPPPPGMLPPGITSVQVVQPTANPVAHEAAAPQPPSPPAPPAPPVAPVQVAMPIVPPAPAEANGNGYMSLEDFREAIRSINDSSPGAPMKIMVATAYRDGTPKKMMFTVESVPPDQRYRIVSESAGI